MSAAGAAFLESSHCGPFERCRDIGNPWCWPSSNAICIGPGKGSGPAPARPPESTTTLTLLPCFGRKLDHTRSVVGPIAKNGVGRTEDVGERAAGHLPTKPTEMRRIERLLPGADITVEVLATRTIGARGHHSVPATGKADRPTSLSPSSGRSQPGLRSWPRQRRTTPPSPPHLQAPRRSYPPPSPPR